MAGFEVSANGRIWVSTEGVRDVGAITVEDVSLGEGVRSDFIVAPMQTASPATASLPNGSMHLLVATAIHRTEMDFGLERGPQALRDPLMSHPDGQVSTLGRRSWV
jgi:hypothetical protein